MARPQARIKTEGLREFIRATDRAGRDTKRLVRETLKPVGEVVREAWSLRFSDIDERSAAGLRTRVRVGNVAVQQSLRKVTGKRPDYGMLQMRYGQEALDDKEDEVVREFEHATDEIIRRWDD